jgi:hypothetical protein
MAAAFPPALSGGLSANPDPHPKRVSHGGDDARDQELQHLRLALATFALQLDAFEARTRRLRVGKTLEIPALRSHNGQAIQKEKDV